MLTILCCNDNIRTKFNVFVAQSPRQLTLKFGEADWMERLLLGLD